MNSQLASARGGMVAEAAPNLANLVSGKQGGCEVGSPAFHPFPRITSAEEGGWLILRALAVPDCGAWFGGGNARPASAMTGLARMTPKLPRVWKWALVPAVGYRLQAELPLKCAGGGHEAALAQFSTVRQGIAHFLDPAPRSAERTEEGVLVAVEELASLSSEAGWSPVRRDDASLAVDLEVPGGRVSASITATQAAVRVYSEMCGLNEFGTFQREALACVLLRMNAGMRWVRAGFFAGDGCETAGIELSIANTPDAETLAQALEALSVAQRFYRREVSMLADERVAALAMEVAPGAGNNT